MDCRGRLEIVEQRLREAEQTIQKLTAVEKRVTQLEEDGKARKREAEQLLDRVEELEMGRIQAERKLEEAADTVKEVAEIRKEVEEERKKWSEALGEMEKRLMEKMNELGGRGNNGGGERLDNNGGGGRRDSGGGGERRENNGGGERYEDDRGARRTRNNGGGERKRCIVVTDSNGRETTEERIKAHIPRGERENYDIEVVTAYTLEEAYFRVGRGEIRTDGALVILDNLTNDVRGTRQRQAATPQDLVQRVGMLRERMRGAAGIITCQVKPMRDVDVSQHNELLSEYLRAQGGTGYGCLTQIRKEHLKGDGFHIWPQFSLVLSKQYACAIMGLDVPCPTPYDDFLLVKDWPYLGGGRGPVGREERWGLDGRNRVHGWA